MDNIYISQEILKRLGVKFKPDKIKQNVSCFDHGPDKKPSMGVDLERGSYHCFACGSSGKLKNKYYEVFHSSIYRDLGINYNVDLLKQNQLEYNIDFNKSPESDFIYEGNKLPVSITEAGRIWTKQRGFTEDLLREFKASYSQFGIFKQRSDPTDKKKWTYVFNRVLFPIYENGLILSYELRDIMGKTHYEKQLLKKNLKIESNYRKILYPKNSSINTLYNLKKLKTDEPLYVVEGLMNLISINTHKDFKNSTCLFHAMPTERQLFLLEKFKKIIYILDNDIPGFMGCKKLMERNNNTYFLSVPDTVNDINDILQKKDNRYSSIEDLIQKNWLSKINPSLSDLNRKIKLLEAKNEQI